MQAVCAQGDLGFAQPEPLHNSSTTRAQPSRRRQGGSSAAAPRAARQRASCSPPRARRRQWTPSAPRACTHARTPAASRHQSRRRRRMQHAVRPCWQSSSAACAPLLRVCGYEQGAEAGDGARAADRDGHIHSGLHQLGGGERGAAHARRREHRRRCQRRADGRLLLLLLGAHCDRARAAAGACSLAKGLHPGGAALRCERLHGDFDVRAGVWAGGRPCNRFF